MLILRQVTVFSLFSVTLMRREGVYEFFCKNTRWGMRSFHSWSQEVRRRSRHRSYVFVLLIVVSCQIHQYAIMYQSYLIVSVVVVLLSKVVHMIYLYITYLLNYLNVLLWLKIAFSLRSLCALFLFTCMTLYFMYSVMNILLW